MRKDEEAADSQPCTEKVLVVCGTDVTTGVTSDNCVGMEEEVCEHTKNGAGSTAEDVIGREDLEEYSSFCYWRLPLDEVIPGDVDFGCKFYEELNEEVTKEEEDIDVIVTEPSSEGQSLEFNLGSQPSVKSCER